MRKSRRSGVVSGITLIVVGLLLFWLDRADYVGQELVFFVVGSVFLGAYLYGKNYGLLIPGCILLGLGAGHTLRNIERIEQPWMVGLGAGFIAIFVIALLYEKRSHWWPLIPGGVLLINAFSSIQRLMNFLFENWPLLLVVIGVFILLSTFRSKRPGKEAS